MGVKSMKTGLEPSTQLALLTYLGFIILYLMGCLKDLLRSLGYERINAPKEHDRNGYPILFQKFDYFYNRNFFLRLRDGWTNSVASVPGATIDIRERITEDYNLSFKYTGNIITAINMGSYNYLGTAENTGPRIEKVCKVIERYGSSTLSTRAEFGTTDIVRELESKMAKYLGVEDSLVLGMGFATNSNNLPILFGAPGTLIMSDELNHASIAVGSKLSKATCKKYKHNDMVDLENKLRRELLKGQPSTTGEYIPWKKAIIVAEGIFSMEGTIVDLPELIRIKKKYKAYLYLDEAHSIGALDKGALFYYKCDPNDVDVLMGTFTKSFGAAGGYIAGSKKLIDYMRLKSHATCYATSMAPAVAQQIIGVIDSIIGHEEPSKNEGLIRIHTLRKNTLYFRAKLKDLGYVVLGNEDSPVVPVMIYSAAILVEIIRAAIKRNVALVGAGFPATPLLGARVRFCISSAHTKEMLDHVIQVMDELGDIFQIKYHAGKKSRSPVDVYSYTCGQKCV